MPSCHSCLAGPSLSGAARNITKGQNAPARKPHKYGNKRRQLVPAFRSSSVRCRHSWRRYQSATHACVLQPPHAGIVGYADACMDYAPAPSASPVACCKAVSTETSAAAAREAQTAMTRLAIAAASPGADVGTSSHSSSTARRTTRTYADGSGCDAQNRREQSVEGSTYPSSTLGHCEALAAAFNAHGERARREGGAAHRERLQRKPCGRHGRHDQHHHQDEPHDEADEGRSFTAMQRSPPSVRGT
jgi:hypothetical protein